MTKREVVNELNYLRTTAALINYRKPDEVKRVLLALIGLMIDMTALGVQGEI